MIRVRTGYEKVVADRSAELYACIAKRDGKVIAVDDTLKLVKVQYDPEKIKTKATIDLKMSTNEIKTTLSRNKFILFAQLASETNKLKSGDAVSVGGGIVLRILEKKEYDTVKDLPKTLTLSKSESDRLGRHKDIVVLRLEPIDYDQRGDIDIFSFGHIHSYVSGSYIQQNIVIHAKTGQKINKGDVIAYNSGFFHVDEYDLNHVNWKHGVPMNIALLEADVTYEDSHAISRKASAQLAFSPAHVRDIKLTKNTVLHSIVKLGDEVQTTDLLCTIEDGDLDALSLTDDPATVEFLSNLNKKAPRARYNGEISEIDVLYSCAIEDMHPTLQTFVKMVNQRKNKVARTASDSFKSSDYLPAEQLPAGSKYKGIDFEDDTVVIFITIAETINHEIGDKAVVYSSAKTVASTVIEKEIFTESGVEIDMLFSGRSIQNRIITSPLTTGCLERVLEKMEHNILDMYFDTK